MKKKHMTFNSMIQKQEFLSEFMNTKSLHDIMLTNQHLEPWYPLKLQIISL